MNKNGDVVAAEIVSDDDEDDHDHDDDHDEDA
jgi:hypothetical protein